MSSRRPAGRISRVERGETQPTTVTARRLADALGADFGCQTDTAAKPYEFSPPPSKRRSTLADNSAIEWTEATWNPVTGCDKVSPGCAHCYAETFAERWRGVPGHPYEQGFASSYGHSGWNTRAGHRPG